VAVLPLQNLSPDPNDEYFADGMTEELISTISKIPELNVISRTSVIGYKKKEKKASEIARELNVGTLLEGSVRKAANRVRISVQLIEAESDRHVWAENYDRNLEDIFAVQSDVADKVASSLRLKLTEEDKRGIEKGGTSSTEAYMLYLKGRSVTRPGDRNSLSAAIHYYEQALRQDPSYALAYSALALAHATLGFFQLVDPKEAYEKAMQYAQKALELDDSLPEAHVALSYSLVSGYDFESQERELKRAIELNPNLAAAHMFLANYYASVSQWKEGLREAEKALELDPLSASTLGSAGTWYLYAGQYEKAIKHLKDAMEMEPTASFWIDNLGLAHIQMGKVEEGLAMVKRAAEMSGTFTQYSGDLAWAYMKAEKLEEVRKLLTELEAEESKDAIATAGVYAVLGEKEKAMEWLEKAYDDRVGYLATIDRDFVFENLRDEPRYQALIEKIRRKKHT
jgi:TolB-like protein/Tfp pilus assembly protein PilF